MIRRIGLKFNSKNPKTIMVSPYRLNTTYAVDSKDRFKACRDFSTCVLYYFTTSPCLFFSQVSQRIIFVFTGRLDTEQSGGWYWWLVIIFLIVRWLHAWIHSAHYKGFIVLQLAEPRQRLSYRKQVSEIGNHLPIQSGRFLFSNYLLSSDLYFISW